MKGKWRVFGSGTDSRIRGDGEAEHRLVQPGRARELARGGFEVHATGGRGRAQSVRAELTVSAPSGDDACRLARSLFLEVLPTVVFEELVAEPLTPALLATYTVREAQVPLFPNPPDSGR